MSGAPDRLPEIDARWDATPAGPWSWFGNTQTKSIALATVHSGRRWLMDFVRWGMTDACPRFQPPEGLGMVRADELVVYERDYRKDFRDIDEPVARALAKSREDVDWLRAEVRRLRAVVEDLADRLDMGCEEPDPHCKCPGCSLARARDAEADFQAEVAQ